MAMCMCVRARAVEIKLGCCELRASMMYAFGRAYGLPYKMATCHSKKGLFNTVYTLIAKSTCDDSTNY